MDALPARDPTVEERTVISLALSVKVAARRGVEPLLPG